MRVHACMRACVCVCVRVRACVQVCVEGVGAYVDTVCLFKHQYLYAVRSSMSILAFGCGL